MKIQVVLCVLSLCFTIHAQEALSSISPFCEGNQSQEFERLQAQSSDFWYAKEIALSPDNRLLAVANLGYGSVEIYNAQTLSLINVLPENPIVYPRNVSLTWSPDSRFLAVGTLIQTGDEASSVEEIEIWDINDYEIVLEIPDVEVEQVIWTANGDKLVVLEAYGDLSVWNSENGMLLAEKHLYTEYNLLPHTITLVFNDNLLIAWDSMWGKIVVWDFGNDAVNIVDGFNTGTDIDMAWNQSQELLAMYSDSLGSIELMNPTSFHTEHFADVGFAFDIAWSPDNTMLAAGTGYGLLLIDAETEEVTSYIGDEYPEFAQIEWFADNNSLASVTRSGIVFTWNIENECLLAVVQPNDTQDD